MGEWYIKIGLLLASLLLEVSCARSPFPFLLFNSSTEESTTSDTTGSISSTTTSRPKFPPADDGPFMDITTGKVITLLMISFSLPIAFMLLLFWRLRKENKYLHSRALQYYRETVLVPRDAHLVNESNNEQHAANVSQMYNTLYDTPPNYEDIVNSTTRTNTCESVEKSQKLDEVAPPSYSTVYM